MVIKFSLFFYSCTTYSVSIIHSTVKQPHEICLVTEKLLRSKYGPCPYKGTCAIKHAVSTINSSSKLHTVLQTRLVVAEPLTFTNNHQGLQ